MAIDRKTPAPQRLSARQTDPDQQPIRPSDGGNAAQEHSEQLSRWLRRHKDEGSGKRLGFHPNRLYLSAMIAIAEDDRLLLSLSQRKANKLALEASGAIAKLKLSEAADDSTTAVIREVESRIRIWRDHIEWWGGATVEERDSVPRFAVRGPKSIDENSLGMPEIIEHAAADYPQIRPQIAQHLVATTINLGASGLCGLGSPMDAVLALGACRMAARSAAGKLSKIATPPGQCREVVRIVQEWTVLSGKNPFLIPSYAGRWGTLVERVKGQAEDARTCHRLAREVPGGVDAPGFQQWELAQEFHAYALASFRNSPIFEMGHVDAVEYATAATRFATKVIAGDPIDVPNLPQLRQPEGPSIVLGATRHVLGELLFRDVTGRPSG